MDACALHVYYWKQTTKLAIRTSLGLNIVAGEPASETFPLAKLPEGRLNDV